VTVTLTPGKMDLDVSCTTPYSVAVVTCARATADEAASAAASVKAVI
jgi:hypothetical protein